MHKSLLLQSKMEETIKHLETKISSKEQSLKKMKDTDLKIIKLQSELQEMQENNVRY